MAGLQGAQQYQVLTWDDNPSVYRLERTVKVRGRKYDVIVFSRETVQGRHVYCAESYTEGNSYDFDGRYWLTPSAAWREVLAEVRTTG